MVCAEAEIRPVPVVTNPERPFDAEVNVVEPLSNFAGPCKLIFTLDPPHEAPDADVRAHVANPLSPTVA